MNKKLIFSALLVGLMVFGITVIGCNRSTDGGGGARKTESNLAGKYVNEKSSKDYVVFREGNEVTIHYDSMSAVGTYSINGSSLTMRATVFGTDTIWDATLSDDKKSFVDTDGDKYIKEE